MMLMNRLLENKVCDLIALGRPLVREPDILPLIKENIRRNYTCSLCNGCINLLPEPIVCPMLHAGC